jgi:GNAT superfamily N-acetyltransferase
MQSILFTILVLVLCIFHLDAFLPSERSRTRSQILRAKQQRGLWASQGPNTSVFLASTTSGRTGSSVLVSSSTSDDSDSDSDGNGDAGDSDSDDKAAPPTSQTALTHKDIVWKLRPPEGTGRRRRLWLRFAANLIRLDGILFRKTLPTALCPKGGQALLEAHTHDANGKLVKVGRFGFTTERGASAEPIQETVSDLYGISTIVGVGAIVYMFVEPEYRKRKIGTMALEVIRCIHSIQNCDFTILVVDDDGTGKLNDWYEKYGYSRAPKLQEILGSPNAIHGISMIAPTSLSVDEDCRIKWW